MTPKEKAKDLIIKFYNEDSTYIINNFDSINFKDIENDLGYNPCWFAKTAVDEILEVTCIYDDISDEYKFWQQVKHELEKL